MPNYIANYEKIFYLTNDLVFYESIMQGKSEPYPKHLDIVKKYMNIFPHKNKTYIDIGTHIGTTIIPYSRLFEKVVGYEPYPGNYKFALHNINLNAIQNATIHSYGLLHEECNGSMKMHTGNNSGCYFFSPNEGGNIQCKKLDDVSENINIDFIKIDVHGSELLVLQGAKETILKWKPLIQIEINIHAKNIYGIENKDTIAFLLNIGYRYFDNSDEFNPFFYFPNVTLSISPKTIYTFWNGKEELSENRKRNLDLLQKISQCNIVTIYETDISKYILNTEPLHPAFMYLSATHKSDYLRTYFLHFYGGGYSDIKKTRDEWITSFNVLENSGENIFGCGYPEIGESCVANVLVTSEWRKLIGNGAYIFKPNTEFTQQWYTEMIQLLDKKLENLRDYYVKNNGKVHPQAQFNSEDEYPIGWNEMLGRIFHPIVFKYHKNILNMLPISEFFNYR
jgi:FkbM family methyltransferase